MSESSRGRKRFTSGEIVGYALLAAIIYGVLDITINTHRDMSARSRVTTLLAALLPIEIEVGRGHASGCPWRTGETIVQVDGQPIAAHVDANGTITAQMTEQIAGVGRLTLRPRFTSSEVRWSCSVEGDVRPGRLPGYCRPNGADLIAQPLSPPSKAGCPP